MMHLGAFYQSVNPGGVLTNINAVPDQAIFTSGHDLRVPTDVPNIIWEAALTAAAGPVLGQIQSPSLRELANRDIEPIEPAAVFSNLAKLQYHGDSPIALMPYESMNFAILATGGVASECYGLVALADGPVKPVSGNIFTVRASAAAALTLGAWVNAPVTFESTLPAGVYQVVGFRASSTNLVAARLVFIGQAYRPGVTGCVSSAVTGMLNHRYGALGVFGQFDVNQPPTVDFLGVTDVAQEVVFDLIKVK